MTRARDSGPLRVSVVIPTFQRREQVLGAVDSALAQTVLPAEVIVVDDGSTDGTAEAVNGRYGERVRLLCQPNQGPSAARNAAIAVATGDVIAFLDSDDRWLPHHLAAIAELFAAHPTAVLVGTQRNLRVAAHERPTTWFADLALPLLRDSEDVGFLPSVAARRTALEAAGGFDEQLRYGEDTELFIRLAFQGPFALAASTTVKVGRSDDSLEREGRHGGAYLGFLEWSADRALAALDGCQRGDTDQLRAAARARRAIGAVVAGLSAEEPVEAIREHLAEVRCWAPEVDVEQAVLRAARWIVPGWEQAERRRRVATALREARRTLDRVPVSRDSAAADPEAHENEPLEFRVHHDSPDRPAEAAWRELVEDGDWPHQCVAPDFFLECCTGQRPFAVTAGAGERVDAVLTGWWEGDAVVSGLTCRPHVCFGPATDRARASDALVRGLLVEAGSAESVTVYTLKPMHALLRAGFRVDALPGTVVLDLRQGPAALFEGFHANRRRNIRQAMRNDIEVFQTTNEEDLAAYYEVYRRWRHTPRKEIYGEPLPYREVAAGYGRPQARRVFLARHEGRVIAGVVVHYLPGGIVENESSASLDEYLHLRPNDLLIWKTVEWACAEGFSVYSMSGIHPFFLRMGGTVVPVYRHRFDRHAPDVAP